jgi:threonyl-tRNA synthetase
MKTKRDAYKSGHVDYNDLDTMRHSVAHLMASAVKELWPATKFGIGPTTEDGFYYDFEFSTKLSDEDLPRIEQKMRELKNKNIAFVKTVLTIENAIAEAKTEKQPYKTELLEALKDKGETEVSIYATGAFQDLCKGPHVASSTGVGEFKLLSTAGAYWKGDEKNKMLTRIYGTSFATKEELEKFLWQKEEAKKRDHRKIGKELELFCISPSVGLGFPLYMPKGLLLRRALENWIIEEKEKRGYKFVWTPHVGKSDLYRQSGHWQKYDAMFNPMKLDDDEYVVKPMNCPHHFQIYNEHPHSYRELPLRLAENATVYRNEKQGELNGLLRVRALTQDDTHTFVRHEQIAEEIDRILELTVHIYETFGFTEYRARVSTRDPNKPEKYLGKPDVWDTAEKALTNAVAKRKIEYFVGVGEASFYGPKIDIMVKDALGREWQLTTVQLDFNQPENFNMTYIDESGNAVRPAVLHIAILGSFDRFIAIVIEQFAGAFPTWLTPIQVKVLPIADRHHAYAQSVVQKLKDANIRVELDDRKESLGAKIRDAQKEKVAYMIVLGDKEVESKMISERARNGTTTGPHTIETFIENITNEIKQKII